MKVPDSYCKGCVWYIKKYRGRGYCPFQTCIKRKGWAIENGTKLIDYHI